MKYRSFTYITKAALRTAKLDVSKSGELFGKFSSDVQGWRIPHLQIV
eukprot:COSAG01_NODE_40135_length_467_cov_1.130435_1_plen_46_part_01